MFIRTCYFVFESVYVRERRRKKGSHSDRNQVHVTHTAYKCTYVSTSSHERHGLSLSLSIHQASKLKPAHTAPLKQAFRIITPTHLVQETAVLRAIAVKRALPVRAVVQAPISMARAVRHSKGVNLLDGAAGRHLYEVVIAAFGPVDREADDHERFIRRRAVVQTQAERVRVALAHPVWQERL